MRDVLALASTTSPNLQPTPRASDRRGHRRFPVWFPVQLDGQELGIVVGITKDASAKGLLLEANGQLVVGAPVLLTFRVSAHHAAQQIEATVVRAQRNDAGVWPYRIAVEFDDALAHLEPGLRRESLLQVDLRG